MHSSFFLIIRMTAAHIVAAICSGHVPSSVHPDYVPVVLVVNVVGEAHYDLGVEIVPAVEKLSLHMLEAGQAQDHFAILRYGGEAV